MKKPGFLYRTFFMLALATLLWGLVYGLFALSGYKIVPWHTPVWWILLGAISFLTWITDFYINE